MCRPTVENPATGDTALNGSMKTGLAEFNAEILFNIWSAKIVLRHFIKAMVPSIFWGGKFLYVL